MRQIMSNTQKSDFLSRVAARCWIQRHLCFHGSHSKSASYSLQQRNKLESKSRSLFVTFECTCMHTGKGTMSCPLLQLLQCQSDDLQCIKKWADVPANSEQVPVHDLLAGPHEQRCSGALFFYLGENCKKARLCSLKPHSPLNQHPRWKMSTVAYRWCTSWQKDQNITEG